MMKELMKDIYGGILTTTSLFALNAEAINQFLTIIISLLSIVWLVIKIYQQINGSDK
jgi:hypothetical protein